IDFFERRGIPFIVAVNCFDGSDEYTEEEIRGALAISPGIPIIFCDARQRESSKLALIRLVRYAMSRLPEPEMASSGARPPDRKGPSHLRGPLRPNRV